MKKSVKILIVILCLIIVGLVTFIVVDKLINKKVEIPKNEESNVVNAINDITNVNEASFKSSEEKIQSNNNMNNGATEKINITEENKLNILGYSSDFNSVDEISTDNMIRLAFIGIHRGWVPRISIKEDSYVEGLGLPYPESYVKSIICSVFGVNMEENTPNKEDGITYKDGYYYYSWGDGDPIPEAVNIEKSNINEDTYFTYDVVEYGNTGIYYHGLKYKVCMDSNGFVKSKKCVNDKLFGDVRSMQYNKANPEDDINAIIAILKAGEKKFITEQKDGYYIYKDEIGNTYEIKEINTIEVGDSYISSDKNLILFDCSLYYTDKNGNDTDSKGYINHIDIAVVLTKNFENFEIHAPADKYIESQRQNNNFIYDYDY